MTLRTKLVRGLAALVLLVFVSLGYLVSYAYSTGPGNGEEKIIEIPRGVGPRGLASILDTAQVISKPTAFVLWLRVTGDLKNIKAGQFEIRDNAKPSEILEILSGRSTDRGVQVVVPEGFTLTRIAEALENAKLDNADGFIEAATNPKLLAELQITGATAEGYLFPDTYFFDKSAQPRDFVEKMNHRFNSQLTSLTLPKSTNLKDVVTLASIVQAEAKILDEMPVIAGVYSNRLTKPEFPARILQADPTVAYGCEPFVKPRAKSCKKFKGTIYRTQLQDPGNPYNTYRHQGLPPGPICAPGIDALKAAIAPAKVPYLYFVVRSNGRHTFSTTLKEHQKAVEQYRRSQSSN